MAFFSRRAYLAALGSGMTGLAGCTSIGVPGDSPVIVEADTPALRDADPTIVVRHLEPGSEVTLSAAANGQYSTWRSEATFQADEHGVVRVSEQAPIAGDYEGVDGAGLVWSLTPENGAPDPWSIEGFTVRLRAYRGDRTLARGRLDRRRVDPGVRQQWVVDEDVVGFYAEPDTQDPRPGVIVLHGSSGKPLTHHAEMFASHGFPALALQYFGQPAGIPAHLEAVPRSYFDGAAAWLRSRPAVRDGPLGVYGFSRGGEAALFLAAYADWVGAVVGDVPSGIAWQGLRRDGEKGSGSAWAVDGEPVPHVSFEGCSPELTPAGLRRDAAFYECGLADADAATIEAATFPIERFDGPIFLRSGAQDGVWPSARLAEFAVERLADAGTGARIVHRSYEDAGHDIPIPHVPTAKMPTAGKRVIGGTPAGIAAAAADSWPRILSTFRDGLA